MPAPPSWVQFGTSDAPEACDRARELSASDARKHVLHVFHTLTDSTHQGSARVARDAAHIFARAEAPPAPRLVNSCQVIHENYALFWGMPRLHTRWVVVCFLPARPPVCFDGRLTKLEQAFGIQLAGWRLVAFLPSRGNLCSVYVLEYFGLNWWKLRLAGMAGSYGWAPGTEAGRRRVGGLGGNGCLEAAPWARVWLWAFFPMHKSGV